MSALWLRQVAIESSIFRNNMSKVKAEKQKRAHNIKYKCIILTFKALIVTFGKEKHGFRRPLRRLQQTLSFCIFAEGLQQELITV
jgi:hypothetical protein